MREDLAAKLDTTEEELRRQNDLKSAKLELGDLVATRNLHIVDVYDADSTGKRDRSFGRVFYVEGKSLVFMPMTWAPRPVQGKCGFSCLG